MEMHRPEIQRSAAGLWRSLLPKTRWGWASLALIAVFLIGLAWFLALKDPLSNFLTMGGLAASFLSALFGVVFRKERGVLPILVAAFGVIAVLFVGAELAGSLLGLPESAPPLLK